MLDINKMAEVYRTRIEQSHDKKGTADSIIKEINSLVYKKSKLEVSKEFKVVLVKKIPQVPYNDDIQMSMGELIELISSMLTNL